MLRRLFLLAATLLGGCSEACTNTVISRVQSPNATQEAVLFQRDCGATTGFSTQISIIGTGASADGIGNAFVADDGHGRARMADWGGPWAEVRWLAADLLLIRYAAGANVFQQRDKMGNVNLSYEAVGG